MSVCVCVSLYVCLHCEAIVDVLILSAYVCDHAMQMKKSLRKDQGCRNSNEQLRILEESSV